MSRTSHEQKSLSLGKYMGLEPVAGAKDRPRRTSNFVSSDAPNCPVEKGFKSRAHGPAFGPRLGLIS